MGWVNGSGWLGWGHWAGKTGWARPIPGPIPAVRWPGSKPHKRVPGPTSFSAHLSLCSPQTSVDQGSLPQNRSELLEREILITSVQRNSAQLWHQLWVRVQVHYARSLHSPRLEHEVIISRKPLSGCLIQNTCSRLHSTSSF